MGIRTFWKVIEGYSVGQEGQLSELRGCSVAVDLSGWIVSSHQLSFGDRKIEKVHIRDLFLKAKHLLRKEVKVVFVLDGTAPALKTPELLRRQLVKQRYKASQKPGNDVMSEGSGTNGKSFARTSQRFDVLVKECCDLLDNLGLPWIKSKGEAEATCAWLNATGIVDGVISNDSDSFLFGAKTVYKDFSCDERKVSFTKYTSDGIYDTLGFSRSHFVALALLLGSDYGYEGVKGIGKEQAVKLLQSWDTKDPLTRFKSWREDKDLSKLESYKTLKKPAHCGKCHHLGSLPHHKKDGCPLCKTMSSCVGSDGHHVTCTCDFHQKKAQYDKHSLEIKICRESIKDASFPNQEIIDAFLNPVGASCEIPSLLWEPPKFSQLKEFMSRHLHWGPELFTRRVFPVAVSAALYLTDTHSSSDIPVKPQGIVKQRTRNGQKCYEVNWTKVEPLFSAAEGHLVELVRVESFSKKFPTLVVQFEQQQALKKSGNKKKSKKEQQSAGRQGTMDKYFKITKNVNRSLFEKSTTKSPCDSESTTSEEETIVDSTERSPTAKKSQHTDGLSGSSLFSSSSSKFNKGDKSPQKHKVRDANSDSNEDRTVVTSGGTPKKLKKKCQV